MPFALLLMLAGGPDPAAMAPVATPAVGDAAPAVVGGYAPIDPHSRELRPVLAAALPSLTPARQARARIVRAEQQVVAGMNYRLLVKLRDGSRWRVVVWRRLDGGYEVTEALRES